MSLDIHLNHPNINQLNGRLTTDLSTHYTHHQATLGKRSKRGDVIAKQARIAASIILKLIQLDDKSFNISLSKRRLDKRKTRYDNKDESYNNVKETLVALSNLRAIVIKIGRTEFQFTHGQEFETVVLRPYNKVPTSITKGENFLNYADIIDEDKIFKHPIELIQIREKTNSKKKQKKNINYRETSQHSQLRTNLEEINRFLATQSYSYNGTSIPFRPLYRVFHNDLNHWGRFQNTVFEYDNTRLNRHLYRINGQDLLSVDFHAFALATHSSLQGEELNQDADLYQQGRLCLLPREFVKVMVQKILNSTTTITRLYSGGRKLLEEERNTYRNKKASLIINLIYTEHPALRTRPAQCLINIESKVLEHILLSCTRNNIPAIPLNDAIYTTEQHIGQVTEFFNEATTSIIGRPIPFRVT
ncbi:hypothetical protein [Thiomicrospira sp. ALE5]|uniref:hypothetical protein n=1 Tax=Thiomicrospira sp. ALE5 TaxID=748650 RepID=UPI0008E2C3C4|nr:hypothetical protein [Thiomicrospira sp. ALE5]SFR54951.1 hypothetical protein SAMN03092900_1076 [Thiomicrospira sp. ALE5]